MSDNKLRKIFNPRIEVFSAFRPPFSAPSDSVASEEAAVASACCACTACTACGGSFSGGTPAAVAAQAYEIRGLRSDLAAQAERIAELEEAYKHVKDCLHKSEERARLAEELVETLESHDE